MIKCLLPSLVNLDEDLVDIEDQKHAVNVILELGLHVADIFIAAEHDASLVPHTLLYVFRREKTLRVVDVSH